MFPRPGSRTSKPGLLCAALALALVLLFLAEAAEGSQVSDADRVRRYWTPQRMESARPLDLVVEAEGRQRLRLGRAAAVAGASFAGVPTPTLPPYSANGRLFLRVGDLHGYCSATAIDSPTRSLVLTAGHCVNEGGSFGGRRWYRDLLFVPAYSGEQRPFGAFPARRGKVFAPPQWTKHGNRDFDVGAFLAYPNNRGEALADAVGGGVAITLDQPRRQEYTTFGYPHKYRWMQTCSGRYSRDDRFTVYLPGPPTLGIACQWVPGASGGGWLIEGGTAIAGLTSYGVTSLPGTTFGPYFTRETVGKLVEGL
jgi:V8-like Glu-specific endopeptidase